MVRKRTTDMMMNSKTKAKIMVHGLGCRLGFDLVDERHVILTKLVHSTNPYFTLHIPH